MGMSVPTATSATARPSGQAQPHGEGEAEASVLRGLKISLLFALIILVVEALGAWFSRSLSLTADAVHDIPDLIAFAVSFEALSLAGKGATSEHTFGLHRAEVFAALVNACLILSTGLGFAYASISALEAGRPPLGNVDPLWLMAAAVPTIVFRSASAILVGRTPGRARDLNLRSVFLHLLSDVLITLALLSVGAILLLRPTLTWVDPAAALFVAAILVWESIPLFRESWATLSEKVPKDLSVEAIVRTARSVPNVEGLHDVHVWSVCSSLVCMTAHVRTADISVRDSMRVIAQLRERLADDFGIVHAVFEVEAHDPSRSHPSDETCCTSTG